MAALYDERLHTTWSRVDWETVDDFVKLARDGKFTIDDTEIVATFDFTVAPDF